MLKQVLHGRQRLRQDLLWGLLGVERADPLRLRLRQLIIGGGDGREETLALAFKAIWLEPALALAGATRRGGHAQQEGAIGGQAACGQGVDRAHVLDAEAPRRALVGQRGVDEAVQQHRRAAGEQGYQELLYQLRARRGVEQRLCARAHPQRRILHQRADALGQRHPAGLAQEIDPSDPPRVGIRSRAPAQLAQQALRQRRFARPIQTLDRDQPPACHAGKVTAIYDACVELPAGLEDHPHARAVLTPAWPPQGQASHAYLFHGPPGTGKRAVARALAAALLAEGAIDPAQAKERVQRGAHPDLTWIIPSGANEMLVGDIEESVLAAVARTPFESRRRVFVLEGAHTMSDQVANRLLKTLEEPPSFAHLILLTNGLGEVLPTIVSRCQQVRFDPLSPARIEERLRQALETIDPGPAQGGSEAGMELRSESLAACARLALGDAECASWLAAEAGQALRESAECYVRDALAGRTRERAWLGVLEQARAAGESAGGEALARSEEELELLPKKERKRSQREAGEAQRRLERRERTRTLQLALGLAELWLRDVWCVAEGAPELVYAVDREAQLTEDAAGRSPARLRKGVELVAATRRRLALNVAEELALEALAYRLEELLAGDSGK